jgi:hypothetical protein
VGTFALQANTTGASNVAVGGYSLLSNTTADNNTAVGYQAGYSNTTALHILYRSVLALFMPIPQGKKTPQSVMVR